VCVGSQQDIASVAKRGLSLSSQADAMKRIYHLSCQSFEPLSEAECNGIFLNDITTLKILGMIYLILSKLGKSQFI
jgi:hypothetical protein